MFLNKLTSLAVITRRTNNLRQSSSSLFFSSSVMRLSSKMTLGRNFSLTLQNFDNINTKQQPSTEEASTVNTENTKIVEADAGENKPTITLGKTYNGIPLHTPPQHIKKLSFLGALARYTFYFVLFIWIFSGYPIYTACQFIYRLIHGEPEPEPVDEDN